MNGSQKSSHANKTDRILVVAPEPFYENRGTPIALRHVVEALSAQKYEVDLITYPIGEQIALTGLRIFRPANPFRIRHVPIGFSPTKLLMDAFLLPIIAERLKENSYCCIHAMEESAFAALILGRRYAVPVIYDMQSSLPEQMKKHRIFRGDIVQRFLLSCERWLIQNADFIACSAGLEEYVRTIDPSARLQAWHFPSQQIDISADQANEFRAELEISDKTHVVLYTGTFESYQGLDVLLEAASMVLSHIQNVVFIFVGAKDNENPHFVLGYEKLLKTGVIRIFARKPRYDIARFLAIADVVVSSRVSCKNLPLKIFDYMMSGKPIVATDSLPHRRVLTEDRAVLVKPSANEMGETITGLLQDRERAERLGSAARAYAQKNFNWDNFMSDILRLYESVSSIHSKS